MPLTQGDGTWSQCPTYLFSGARMSAAVGQHCSKAQSWLLRVTGTGSPGSVRASLLQHPSDVSGDREVSARSGFQK